MAFRVDDEKDLYAQGYRKGPDGKFYRPKSDSQPTGDIGARAIRTLEKRYGRVESKVFDGSTDQSSEPKSVVSRKTKRSNKTNQDNERTSEREPRFRIVVTVYSRRKIDPDNLFAKYFIDPLVQRGIIPEDNSGEIAGVEKIVRRCASEEEERTEVEVYERCTEEN